MFGKNIPIKPVRDSGTVLRIIGLFKTIQGEGPFSGIPAIFIRLAGCNLACHFCDTEFTEGAHDAHVDHIVEEVKRLSDGVVGLVVLTGGEPMAQNIVPLCTALSSTFPIVVTQIETAGTVWPGEDPQDGEVFAELLRQGDVVLVCSPKTGIVHRQVERYCEHYKYIVRAGELSTEDGLPEFSTQAKGERARIYRSPEPENGTGQSITTWVSPCDEYQMFEGQLRYGSIDAYDARDEAAYLANVRACVESALKYDYRISLQVHKMLGVA